MNFTPYLHKVNYYETDKMGIVHHSNYIRWFEDTRLHFLECAGYSYEEMEKDGIMIPVLGVSVRYKAAVLFGDTVAITPKIVFFNGFKLGVEYEVKNAETGVLNATGTSEHFFTDADLKPLRVKNKFPRAYDVFNNVLNVDLLP
jgi:acyl-CoA thioester hydrolase